MMRRCCGGAFARRQTGSLSQSPFAAPSSSPFAASPHQLSAPHMIIQERNYRRAAHEVDHIGDMVDVRHNAVRKRPKRKQFNFLRSDRFVESEREVYKPPIREEGTLTSLFARTNNYSNLIHMRIRQWLQTERIEGAKYIPADLAARLTSKAMTMAKVPGVLPFSFDVRIFHKTVSQKTIQLPYDLLMQYRHGLINNFARSPEAVEWKQKLDIDNVDLTKAVFCDIPITDILCGYVQGCYGKEDDSTVANKVEEAYRAKKSTLDIILRELLRPTVGQKLVDYKLAKTSMPLSHQATIAATILYRNHPLMPQSDTIVGTAKIRYDALQSRRNEASLTRVAKGMGDDGEDIASILDPRYKVNTDICGLADYLDSAAYLSSTRRLVLYRNAQVAAALMHRRLSTDGTVHPTKAIHTPQMDFIARIVNTMSASEQQKIVDYVDKFQHRICRELERELVAVSAFRAYVTHLIEYRYVTPGARVYQFLFESASIMHSCVPARQIALHAFWSCSIPHRRKYAVFVPQIPMPYSPRFLWQQLFRREAFARGNRFAPSLRTKDLSKPFEYGDGAPSPTMGDFDRLTMLQRAAMEFAYPIKLTMGEGGKSFANPFNNYSMTRYREMQEKGTLPRRTCTYMAMQKVYAREWYALPQELKNQYDVQYAVPRNETITFPLNGNRTLPKIDLSDLPSEPIATPLPPVSKRIAERPEVVNMGRFVPPQDALHKDPLTRTGFAKPTADMPLAFFARKAMSVIRQRLDARMIAKNPKVSTAPAAGSRKGKTGTRQYHLAAPDSSVLISRLQKLPQQRIPEVVLAELHRSGVYDQKQPIAFDMELGKEAMQYRVNTLRAENPLRTAITIMYHHARNGVRETIGFTESRRALAEATPVLPVEEEAEEAGEESSEEVEIAEEEEEGDNGTDDEELPGALYDDRGNRIM